MCLLVVWFFAHYFQTLSDFITKMLFHWRTLYCPGFVDKGSTTYTLYLDLTCPLESSHPFLNRIDVVPRMGQAPEILPPTIHMLHLDRVFNPPR